MALADAFIASRTVGAALEERVNQLQEEIDSAQEESRRVSDRLASLNRSDNLHDKPLNLIKLLWDAGEREALKRIFDILIERVIVRLDEVALVLSVPMVCGKKQKPPATGFEPVTYRLTAGRSAVELRGKGRK